MRIIRLACFLFPIVLSASLLAAPPPATSDAEDFTGLIVRKWYDAAGRHTIEAKLVDSSDGMVKLEKPDGKSIEIPFTKLSPIDRAYVQWAAPLVENLKAVPRRTEKLKTMTNSLGMKLVLIPPGEFVMGDEVPSPQLVLHPDRLAHRVRISKPFFLGIHEVTQEEFQTITGVNPSWFCAQGDGRQAVAGMDTRRFPVEAVEWFGAKEFCDRLSKKEGRTYRLPTEAEWEYACRAGTTATFHCGKSLTSVEANIDGAKPRGGPKRPALGRTTTVGSYRPNAFGLYDMHGNVAEWCSDWMELEYGVRGKEENGTLIDPQGPETGPSHAIRNGSYSDSAEVCGSACREMKPPKDGRFSTVGFRVVCEP